ncbi:MAG: hypothetical protein LBE82_00370, partial [Chitinophagaceae bacterium]|nr:hypothetical protein [Chitinophagaceae bacterium]
MAIIISSLQDYSPNTQTNLYRQSLCFIQKKYFFEILNILVFLLKYLEMDNAYIQSVKGSENEYLLILSPDEWT